MFSSYQRNCLIFRIDLAFHCISVKVLVRVYQHLLLYYKSVCDLKIPSMCGLISPCHFWTINPSYLCKPQNCYDRTWREGGITLQSIHSRKMQIFLTRPNYDSVINNGFICSVVRLQTIFIMCAVRMRNIHRAKFRGIEMLGTSTPSVAIA